MTQAQDLPDVQSATDDRGWYIDEVGVSHIQYPIRLPMQNGIEQHTVAKIKMTVSLSKTEKGTHMSRFMEELNHHVTKSEELTPLQSSDLIQKIQARLDAELAFLEMRFPIFLERFAPITSKRGLMPYIGIIQAIANKEGETNTIVGIGVTATSLCPCSKEISEYGAHNQRSQIEMLVQPRYKDQFIWFEDLVYYAESAASSQLYPVLKRLDEKVVTERAYNNPRFVEDIVRDVAIQLKSIHPAWFRVTATNEESIHAHNAFARIEWGKKDSRFTI